VAAAAKGSNDVVVDSAPVYVTGQGYTRGTPALAYFLTVVAYDRATERGMAHGCQGREALHCQRTAHHIALDGSLVAIGYASRRDARLVDRGHGDERRERWQATP